MSGTKFFKNFPETDYRFGDNERPVPFDNLSVYIDIFDQVREDYIYYESYYIKNNQRPDQLSYEIYGTTDYYWTFFLSNEHLRVHGWPLDNSEIYAQAKLYYPNQSISTNGVSTGSSTNELGVRATDPLCVSTKFIPGAWVWIPSTRQVVQILRIDQQLATIYLDTKEPISSGYGDSAIVVSAVNATLIKQMYIDALAAAQEDDSVYTLPNFQNIPDLILETTTIEKAYLGYDSIHHYERDVVDSFTSRVVKQWVYPQFQTSRELAYAFDWSTVSTEESVTYLQRMQETNDDIRSISIIRPSTITQVVSEFNALLKQRL